MIPRQLRPFISPISVAALAAVVALMCIGIGSIYGAELAGSAPAKGLARKQLMNIAVALTALVAVQIPSYQKIGRYAYPCFFVSLILLVVVFHWEIRHSHRWIPLPGPDLQPSELAKITFVVALARYLRYRENYRRFLGLFGPFLLALFPLALILLEPDLGTAVLLLPVLFVMLFVAGAKLRHLLAIVLCGVLVAPPMFLVMTSSQKRRYQRARITAIVLQNADIRKRLDQPDSRFTRRVLRSINRVIDTDALWRALARKDGRALRALIYPKGSTARWVRDEGLQLSTSKITLGSGGLTGQGMSGKTYLRFLPDSHNDFIFAILAHQWGFLGCMVVLLAYLVLVVSAVETATVTNDPFGRLLAVGGATLISAQVIINVSMTVGILPTTGMTLPFVSYGGSSLLANSIAVGLMLNVAARRPLLLIKRPFEFPDEES